MLKVKCPNCNLFYDADSDSVCPYCAASSKKGNEIDVLTEERSVEKKGLKSIFSGISKKGQSVSSTADNAIKDYGKPSTTFQGSVSGECHNKKENDTSKAIPNFSARENMNIEKTQKLSSIPDIEEFDSYFHDVEKNSQIQSTEEKDCSEMKSQFKNESKDGKSLRETIDSSIDTDKTIGVIRTVVDSSPVVGWLVCLKGAYQGESFELHQGKNHIGRAMNMSVALAKEKTVSRDKHATVIFDPENYKFYIVPGESNALTYLNANVLFTSEELKAKDIIKVGSCELVFIPLCDNTFNWNDYIG